MRPLISQKRLSVLLVLAALNSLARSAEENQTKAVSFYKDIRPIFQANCQGCHQPSKDKGKYIMTDFAKLIQGGDSGDPAIVPGDPQNSYLVEVITPIDGEEEMPQKGISFLLIDMHSPGITVQPIVTLDKAPEGDQEINTVFFENVKVPKENLIGEEGKGWTYAKYLLEFERGNGYSSELYEQLNRVRKVAETISANGIPLSEDDEFIKKTSEVEVQINAMEATELRILGSLSAGQNVGPESSLLKTRGTEIGQLITEMAVEAVDYYAIPFNNPGPGSNELPIGSAFANTSAPRYFNYRKASIYAGSNEIQRNIMAKLVLGLT